MALTDNLVSYYKFDNDTVTDELGSFNLTNVGTVDTTSGKINSGRLSSTGDYMYTDSPWFPTSGYDLTVMIWLYYTDNGATYNLFISQSDGTHDWFIGTNAQTKELRVTLQNTLGTRFDLNSIVDALTNNAWNFVTVVINDTAKTVVGKVNNIEFINTTYIGTIRSQSTYSQVGGYGKNIVNSTIGTLDEVGVWSRALSSTEITQLYNSGAGLAYPFVLNKPASFLQLF